MSKPFGVAAATVLVAAGLSMPAAAGSTHHLQVGIFDQSYVITSPAEAFPLLHKLRVQVLRLSLDWSKVARTRPRRAANPNDPNYDWSLPDRLVRYAAYRQIKVLFSIYGTPSWASAYLAPNHAPKNAADLQNFAYAAATRYSGTFKPRGATKALPAVRLWLAWNEPNNPVFLKPQWSRVSGRWVAQSAKDYVAICTAVWTGVHSTGISGEKVACGATAPRGNNAPTSSRPSVAPQTFLAALKRFGLRDFDAYAHHPYAGSPHETPTTKPTGGAVTLANIGSLISELTRLYGPKPLWITEYGYQTN
ncbi:MAG: hypothetical protein WBB74_00380, partial [Gaiellaceae bacterium]